MKTGRCINQHRSDQHRANRRTELTDLELRTIRGGDECLVGFRQIDLDGDGVVDAIEPIYEECLKSLSNTLPAA